MIALLQTKEHALLRLENLFYEYYCYMFRDQLDKRLYDNYYEEQEAISNKFDIDQLEFDKAYNKGLERAREHCK